MPTFPNFFETPEEARMRLRRTIVKYKDDFYHIMEVSNHRQDGKFRVYMEPLGRNYVGRDASPSLPEISVYGDPSINGQILDEYLDSYGPMNWHRGRTGGIAADGVPSNDNNGGNELHSAATPASPASARSGRRSELGSRPPLGSPSSLWSPSSSAGGSPGKRKRRVPYTEAEKRALVEGVARFGVGGWKEILAHGKDVFQPNGRTNVNLKDLYRTMEKKGEV